MVVPSWTQIHDAVQNAICAATGLPDGKVIWDYGNSNAPNRPYIAMKFGSVMTIGQDYVEHDYDALRPAGQKIRFSTRGLREMALEIAAFTDSVADSSDAQALAELAKTALILPSVRSILSAASISPFDPGIVQYVPEIVNINFRGRAVCTIRCYVPAPLVQEFAGYIEKVEGTVTEHGGTPDPNTYPWSVP